MFTRLREVLTETGSHLVLTMRAPKGEAHNVDVALRFVPVLKKIADAVMLLSKDDKGNHFVSVKSKSNSGFGRRPLVAESVTGVLSLAEPKTPIRSPEF